MYHLQSDWPRFSLPKFSHNSIYVFNIVKFKNGPIQNLFSFLQQTSMDLLSVGKLFLSWHFTIQEGEIFENRSSVMFFKMI